MKQDLNSLFRLTKKHVQQASKVSGRAFQDYPTSVQMFPDEKERKEKIIYGFELIYKYGLKNGKVYAVSENLEGIAIWLPPNKVHQSTWSMIRYGGIHVMRKSGLKAMKRSMPLYNYMGPAHKRLAPFEHWYLQSLAVEPEEQGKGYGSLLLKAMFRKTDEQGLPIYLETNKEKNVSFYQKHDFEVLEHKIVPKAEIPFWCMLRKP